MTWSPSFRNDVLYEFATFTQETDDFGSADRECLDTYLGHWLYNYASDIKELTGGDFTTWLEVILIVIDAYEKNPSMLNYGRQVVADPDSEAVEIVPPVERRVTRMLELEEWGASYLDPHWFRTLMAAH